MARPVEDDFFHKAFRLLGSKLQETSEDLVTSFGRLTTDKDRVSFVNQIGDVCTLFKASDFAQAKKSSAIAQEKRNEGNKFFKNGQYAKALSLYNASVAASPSYREGQSGKNELALGYSNRSAALFYQKRYQECLADIANALKAGYSKDLQHKLFDRRGKCLLALKHINLAKEAFEEARALVQNAKMDEKKREGIISGLNLNLKECDQVKNEEGEGLNEVKKNTPSVADGPHDTFVSLSSACDVTFTENQGRFILAKRDVNPGEVILVEKPYASVVLPDQHSSHCHHCFVPCVAPIPCSLCPSALYCCVECRDTSWEKYHKYECHSLEIIQRSGVGKFGHLALRTVTASGPEFLSNFRKTKVTGENLVSEKLKGSNDNGLYQADDYNTIYHLVTHAENRTAQDLFKRAVMALFLVKCLERSSFFTDIPDEMKEDSAIFIGGLILSHLQSFPCNAHEIAELEFNESSVGTSLPQEIGAGIYATLSLFNHSCDPTVNRNFYRDTCVVRAIKTIKKGEEVSDNYGAVYAVQSKAERHQKLTPQYYFECRCEPCMKDWPLYPNIESDNPTFKCTSCRKPLTKNDLKSCPSCTSELNMTEIRKALSSSEDVFQEGFEKLLKNDIESALPKLLTHIVVLDRHVVLPWRDYNNCQEAVKQCFSIMGNCVKI